MKRAAASNAPARLAKQSRTSLTPSRSFTSFLKTAVSLKGYSVLGTQLTVSNGVVERAESPGGLEAFVDPAGLPFIQRVGPAGAGGASGAIYKHIGIARADAFPDDVKAGVQAEGDAKYHCYEQTGAEGAAIFHHVVHTVGPDLRVGEPSWEGACEVLGRAYSNVLHQFLLANSGRTELPDTPPLHTLRLLPISGGIFAGAYQARIQLPTLLPATTPTYLLLPTACYYTGLRAATYCLLLHRPTYCYLQLPTQSQPPLPTYHLLTTYFPPTYHLLTTYSPPTHHPLANHAHQDRIAPLTLRALALGFRQLSSEKQRTLRAGTFSIHLCVFLEKEMAAFAEAYDEGCGC